MQEGRGGEPGSWIKKKKRREAEHIHNYVTEMSAERIEDERGETL